MIKTKSDSLRILAVCGGNGSWIHPLSKYLVGNVEPRGIFHTPKENQWKINFGDIPMSDKLDGFKKVDIIVGAPDCGSGSVLTLSRSKKFSNINDNNSFNFFLKAIIKKRPRLFFLENLSKAKDDILNNPSLLKRYRMFPFEGSVIRWGNSQLNRKRLVVVGVRKDTKSSGILYKLLRLMDKTSKPKTCSELLKDLPENGNYREDINSEVTMYSGFKTTLKDVKAYWDKNPGCMYYKAKNRSYTNAPGVYRNLSDRYPQVARKANRQFNPSGYQMSPRELARIQGIPDSFLFYSDNTKPMSYWINKGRVTATKCPPYEVGEWILNFLEKQ